MLHFLISGPSLLACKWTRGVFNLVRVPLAPLIQLLNHFIGIRRSVIRNIVHRAFARSFLALDDALRRRSGKDFLLFFVGNLHWAGILSNFYPLNPKSQGILHPSNMQQSFSIQKVLLDVAIDMDL